MISERLPRMCIREEQSEYRSKAQRITPELSPKWPPASSIAEWMDMNLRARLASFGFSTRFIIAFCLASMVLPSKMKSVERVPFFRMESVNVSACASSSAFSNRYAEGGKHTILFEGPPVRLF